MNIKEAINKHKILSIHNVFKKYKKISKKIKYYLTINTYFVI